MMQPDVFREYREKVMRDVGEMGEVASRDGDVVLAVILSAVASVLTYNDLTVNTFAVGVAMMMDDIVEPGQAPGEDIAIWPHDFPEGLR
jgi:hypothetical protein